MSALALTERLRPEFVAFLVFFFRPSPDGSATGTGRLRGANEVMSSSRWRASRWPARVCSMAWAPWIDRAWSRRS